MHQPLHFIRIFKFFFVGALLTVLAGCTSPGPLSSGCTLLDNRCGYFKREGTSSFKIFNNQSFKSNQSRIGYELCSREKRQGFEYSDNLLYCKGTVDPWLEKQYKESEKHFATHPNDSYFPGGNAYWFLSESQLKAFSEKVKTLNNVK
jgi:hypothetical protein